MFEIVAEIVFGIVGELLVEWPFGRDRRSPRKRKEPHQHAFRVKLFLGAMAGFGWGFYLGNATDVEWPRTALSFALIGTVALAFYLAEFSNERATERISNQFVKGLAMITPKRSLEWAKFSFIITTGIAIGFLVGPLAT